MYVVTPCFGPSVLTKKWKDRNMGMDSIPMQTTLFQLLCFPKLHTYTRVQFSIELIIAPKNKDLVFCNDL